MADDSMMGRQDVTLEDTVGLLRRAQRVLIVSHRRPDGDCIGSTTGLLLGLQQLGKDARAYNQGPFLESWQWLSGAEQVSNVVPDFEPDLTVYVDCGNADRVSDTFKPMGETLNIDHHLSNSKFANHNYIDIEACAVGDVIFELLNHLEVKVTKEIAAALYVSVMTDTGCFRYSNTNVRAFRVAAALLEAGAQPGYLSQQIYETRTRGEVLLTGKVFSNIRFESEGRIAWAELMLADYEGVSGAEDEPEGLSSELRGIRGVEISVLFHEAEEGGLRASLRGKGTVDCSAIAEALGGGGHFNAAGLSILDADYDAARQRVLEEMKKAVASATAR